METTSSREDGAPYDICVSCACSTAGIDPEQIVRALRETLARHQRPSCELSVALVDDATMTAVHEQHLGIAGPTDVLAFDLGEGRTDHVDGEIVVSLDVAARESNKRGHRLADEVLLYTIHGLLHLLGYDDQDESDAQAMHAREDELLIDLGVGPVYRGTDP